MPPFQINIAPLRVPLKVFYWCFCIWLFIEILKYIKLISLYHQYKKEQPPLQMLNISIVFIGSIHTNQYDYNYSQHSVDACQHNDKMDYVVGDEHEEKTSK